jgi:hypothetical protein
MGRDLQNPFILQVPEKGSQASVRNRNAQWLMLNVQLNIKNYALNIL